MKFWTVHLRSMKEPLLVREGFSWGALIFGWLWLLLHRAWIPAVLLWAVTLLAAFLAPAGMRGPILIAIVVLQGFYGNDLWRWALERQGYLLTHVVSGTDEEGALARLLQRRPDLVDAFSR